MQCLCKFSGEPMKLRRSSGLSVHGMNCPVFTSAPDPDAVNDVNLPHKLLGLGLGDANPSPQTAAYGLRSDFPNLGVVEDLFTPMLLHNQSSIRPLLFLWSLSFLTGRHSFKNIRFGPAGRNLGRQSFHGKNCLLVVLNVPGAPLTKLYNGTWIHHDSSEHPGHLHGSPSQPGTALQMHTPSLCHWSAITALTL